MQAFKFLQNHTVYVFNKKQLLFWVGMIVDEENVNFPNTFDAFKLWCWRRFESPLDSKEIKPVNPKIRSDQISRSVVSDSLRPHESQHATPPCPSPTPGVHPDSRPSSQWCHPAISSSVVPFSSCPQIPPSISLFQWVNSSHEVAKVLKFQL